MKKLFVRLLYAVLSVGAIIANFAISGLIIAGVDHLKWLAYPAYFGAYMLLNGLVFLVIAPARRKDAVAIPFLRRFLTVDDKRFSKGIWLWVRERGPFALVLVSSLLLGPFPAAFVIRFLGLPEHRAWMYSFVTTLITAAIWVSFYLGIFGLIRSLLISVI
jgi:hypothetical protein